MSDVNGFLTRPLVLICPGGGYEFTFDRKAEAIAVQYIARGFHACVLRYSVVPAKFPQSLYELAWSVAYLRKHAAEYGIKPDKIIVAGFSAGGHLAASLGVFWDKDWLAKETELSAEQMKPNGLLLSYYKEKLMSMTPGDVTAEIRETLSALKAAGISVASSSKNTKFILKQVGLDDDILKSCRNRRCRFL